MLEWLIDLDGGLLLWIQEYLRGPVLNTVFTWYTALGNAGTLFLALGVIMLFFKRTRKAGVTVLVAVAIGFVCTNLVLKNLVARPRPWLDVAGLVPLIYEGDPNSFPSGHTTVAFAFAGGMIWAAPRKWMRWVALIVAILMGFSRLYVGVHYVSDVLAGVVVGLLAGLLAWKLVGNRKRL